MSSRAYTPGTTVVGVLIAVLVAMPAASGPGDRTAAAASGAATVRHAAARDVSPPLQVVASGQRPVAREEAEASSPSLATTHCSLPTADVEQTKDGTKPPPELVTSFDGLGAGFE